MSNKTKMDILVSVIVMVAIAGWMVKNYIQYGRI